MSTIIKPLNLRAMNQYRMMRIIKLIQFLQVKPRPVHSMARYLGISTRSVYRYLKMYEKIGYDVQRDSNYKYYINETL
jgi:DNA-binding IclR family transcriptional regulator